MLSLPRHKSLGSCQGPFNSPALPSPAGLFSEPPPYTYSLVHHARACPVSREAVPEALVPTQVWLPLLGRERVGASAIQGLPQN